MNSPKVIHFIIALVCAAVGYVIANSIELSAVIVAVIAFASAIVASLFSDGSPSTSNDSDDVKTLYVGNLPYRANEGAVRALFSEYGQVHSVRLMKDKHTGKRRGFGFVEMASNDISGAIEQLNDSEFQQRTLKVREAKERPEKSNEE